MMRGRCMPVRGMTTRNSVSPARRITTMPDSSMTMESSTSAVRGIPESEVSPAAKPSTSMMTSRISVLRTMPALSMPRRASSSKNTQPAASAYT